MAFIFQEEAGDWSPEQTTAALREGHAQWSYRFLGITSASDIINAFVGIFGTTDIAIGPGNLSRTLPVSHPLFPYWFARSIVSFQGLGGSDIIETLSPQPPVTVIGQTPTWEAPPLTSTFGLYPEYKIVIDFGPVPYAVLSDNTVFPTSSKSWTNTIAQTNKFGYANNEWLRFTNWVPTPQFDFLTYQQGNMIFQTVANVTPNNQPFAGFPRIFLPNQSIRFLWNCVPMRYITSTKSFLNRFAGTINQFDFYNWTRGTLLYLGYKPAQYTPPVPELAQYFVGTFGFSTEKLVDLELNFLWTTRTSPDAPVSNSLPNANWLALGHNLLPWHGDRQFHYAHVDNTVALDQVPSWFSFPFELLFTDPDASFPGIIQP